MVLIMYNNQLYIHETNLNNKLSISKDSNDKKLAGVATLESYPPSCPPEISYFVFHPIVYELNLFCQAPQNIMKNPTI